MGNFITEAQKLSSKSAGTASTPQTQWSATSSGRLSFYQNPPNSIISIEDFELYAINRLRGRNLVAQIAPSVYVASI